MAETIREMISEEKVDERIRGNSEDRSVKITQENKFI